MSITPLIGRPGISTARTAAYRTVLKQLDNARYYPGGGVIKGTSRDPGNSDNLLLLRPGLLMGRLSSGTPKMWMPSLIGVTEDAYVTGTTLVLTPAAAVELVRRVGTSGTFKLTGPPDTAGVVRTVTVTYSAVNTSTGDVTVTNFNINEVQTLTFNGAASAGNYQFRIPMADGTMEVTSLIAWHATDATLLGNIQTALDNSTGVANGIVVTGAAPDTALTFTFSGTGFAGNTYDLIEVVIYPTTPTHYTNVRTTTGQPGAMIAGSFVQPEDGSETPRSLIGDGTGMLMAVDSSNVDWPHILVGGDIDSSQILDWPSDTSLRQWVVDALNANGVGKFTFDHLMAQG